MPFVRTEIVERHVKRRGQVPVSHLAIAPRGAVHIVLAPDRPSLPLASAR
jgi:hypothetical protein